MADPSNAVPRVVTGVKASWRAGIRVLVLVGIAVGVTKLVCRECTRTKATAFAADRIEVVLNNLPANEGTFVVRQLQRTANLELIVFIVVASLSDGVPFGAQGQHVTLVGFEGVEVFR